MSSTNIRVVVRVRPLNRAELVANQRSIIRVLDQQNLVFDPEDDVEEFFYHGVKQAHRDLTKRQRKKLPMEYDDVFDTNSTNLEVYETSTQKLLDSLMAGFNCSVFVYGATGAGKTFTMLGNMENPGITFLTMRGLFEKMAEFEADRKFDIGISYLEVYNEQVMNLLVKGGPLNLREDAAGVVVSGLQLKQIHNATELLNLLAEGNKNRSQHPTDANAESSRSHAIFQVHIRMTDKKTNTKRLVKLSMIDLAGSERAASTQCKGARFKEGANINKSLLALGNCINKLAEGSKFVPYRDSKLTRILKDSLGGNCQTVMIANISPSSLTYDDTHNTLKYASRAKKIKTSLRQNVIQSNVPKEYLIKKANEATEENERLKQRIKQLEAKLAEYESRSSDAKVPQVVVKTITQEVDKTWYTKIDTVYETLRISQEQYFAIRSREKINSLKKKLKSYMEMIKASLELNLDEEMSRIEASVEKSSKQMQKDKDDLHKYGKIHRQANSSLEKLKNDIKIAGLDGALCLYLSNKNFEFNNHKVSAKNNHIQKVNGIYNAEIDHWKEMLNAGFQLLQKLYLLLRSFDRVDPTIDEEIKKLQKQCSGRQKIVKFLEENNHLMVQDAAADLSFTMPDSPAIAVVQPQSSGKKRRHEETQPLASSSNIKVAKTSGSGTFVKPKAVKSINFNGVVGTKPSTASSSKQIFKVPPNLNETHTIEMTNLNSTFNLGPTPKGGILSESGATVNARDSAVMEKFMKQTGGSKVNLLNKAAITINKENKKFKTPHKYPSKSPKKIAKGPTLNGVHKARVNLKPLNPNTRISNERKPIFKA